MFKFETEEYTGPIGCRLEYHAEYFESGGICEEFANKFGGLSLEEILEVTVQSVHEVRFLPFGGWFGARRRVTFKVLFEEGEKHLFYGDGKDFHEALFVALAALNATKCICTKEEYNERMNNIRRQLQEVQNDPNLIIVTHYAFG